MISESLCVCCGRGRAAIYRCQIKYLNEPCETSWTTKNLLLLLHFFSFEKNHNNILCFYDLCWLTKKKFVEIIPFFCCCWLVSFERQKVVEVSGPIGESVPVHIKREVPFCVTAAFKKKCTHNIDENKTEFVVAQDAHYAAAGGATRIVDVKKSQKHLSTFLGCCNFFILQPVSGRRNRETRLIDPSTFIYHVVVAIAWDVRLAAIFLSAQVRRTGDMKRIFIGASSFQLAWKCWSK